MEKKGWLVEFFEFFIGLMMTGNPKVDRFLKISGSVLLLIIVSLTLLSWAVSSMQEDLPTILSPLGDFLTTLFGGLGQLIGGIGGAEDAINQIPPAVSDVPQVAG